MVVEVGKGATIDIAGKGKIGNKDVFFVPDLNKTVIATDNIDSFAKIPKNPKNSPLSEKNKKVEINRVRCQGF